MVSSLFETTNIFCTYACRYVKLQYVYIEQLVKTFLLLLLVKAGESSCFMLFCAGFLAERISTFWREDLL